MARPPGPTMQVHFLDTIEDLALEGKEALAQLQAQQVHLGVRLPQAELEILSYHHLK